MKVLGAFFFNVLFNFVIGLLVARFLGPDEYGRFALAFATAVAVQTAFLDWIRLGATRFYSQRARESDPALRATLDVAFALVVAVIVIGSTLLFLSGLRFPLSNVLIGLALSAAIANGLFDFNTALVRARFQDSLYVKLIVVKNLMALVLTGGGAFYFGSAKMTLIGSVLSMAGSVIFARASLSDAAASADLAQRSVARSLFRYAAPIVAANLLYISLPLANRALVTVWFGFAETGQFSLAYDIGSKAVQAIGSTLDVVLFQIAVAAHERHGAESAKQHVADNMAVVIAIMLPSCAGLWLVLPSVQHLVVPELYRGPFEHLLTLMMPGLFCFAMILYAVNPIFQIAKRTGPLVAAAAVACVADPAILFAMPHQPDASSLAVAQSGAFALALVALVVIAGLSQPIWPRWRDMSATVLATGAMAAILLPLRDHPPGLGILIGQILGGTLIYGALVACFDIAGIRTLAMRNLQPYATRFRTS